MNLRRSSFVALAAGALALTACGDSAPPAAELVDEIIDTVRVDGGEPLSDEGKACMRQEADEFIAEIEGFDDLDHVVSVADDPDAAGQQDALAIIEDLKATLATCVTPG